MAISKAKAQWEGSLAEGHGGMTPAHAVNVPFSLGSRFEGKSGSNPEEMIGAALAGCYSMALAAALGQAGLAPRNIRTEASVYLDKDGPGFRIGKIELETMADVPGADAMKFNGIAEETKKNCPVSKALAGTTITLKAKLT